MFRHRPVPAILSLLALAAAAPGCSTRQVDVAKALKVTDVITGWFDAGIVEGNKNKLVPSISLRLKNLDAEAISSVQMIARFAQVGDSKEWGSAPYVRVIGPEGLAPGQSTGAIVLRCDRGYTGEQPRALMLQHSQFVDVRVELFAKHGPNQYVKLGEWAIARQLLTN
jgi:hypothetical protein